MATTPSNAQAATIVEKHDICQMLLAQIRPGYYSVAPAKAGCEGDRLEQAPIADWLCTPTHAPSEANAAGEFPIEKAAFPNDAGDGTSLRFVPAGSFKEGYIAKVDEEGKIGIAWEEMFGALGVSPLELMVCLRKTEFKEIDGDSLGAVYSALTGDVLTEAQMSTLSKECLQNVVKLCLRKGAFCREATPSVRLLSEAPARKDDDVNRLRYALSLSRRPCEHRTKWEFDAGRFRRDCEWLPSCYDDDLLSIGRAVEAVCSRGERPTVLLKAPEGAPVDDIVSRVVHALVEDGRCIDIGGVSSSLDLLGCSSSFSGALPGLVARGIHSHGDLPIVIRSVSQLEKLKKDDGDPLDFVARLCGSGGSPTDSYIGVSMRVLNPVILTTELAGSKKLESACNVVCSIHRLTRGEKIATLADALRSAGLRASAETVAFVVDNWCFDDGTALMEDAIKAIVHGVSLKNASVTRKDIERLLPTPDRTDPRYMAGRKRAIIEEQEDDRYRLTVDELLDALADSESPAKNELLRKLKILLGSIPDGTELPRLSPEELEGAVARTHPHLGNIGKIAGALSASLKGGTPVLLEGPAGTGKTTLSEALAESLGGVPFVKRDFPGMSVQELYGSTGSPSLLTEALAAFDGKPGVLLIDEVDKPSSLSAQSLLSLLDMKKYVDSYLNLPVDLSGWLIVLTANDLESVSPYVRNRVRAVEVPGYTPAEKAALAKDVLVDRAASLLGQPPAHFSDEALDCAASMDDDAGLRAFERRIEDLCALYGDAEVSAIDVKSAFPAETPCGMGVRVIMPRSGAKGGAALACVCGQRDNGLKKPEVLSAPAAFEASLRLAQLAARWRGIPSCGVAASMVEAGDDIDHSYCPYSQLGTAVMLALVESGMSSDLPHVAFVGELHPTGELKATRPKDEIKIPFLISRAKVHGIDTIVCSPDFKAKAEAFARRPAGIDLVPVNVLTEAIDYAKSVQSLDAFLESISR